MIPVVLEPPMPLSLYCERYNLTIRQVRDLHKTQGFPLKRIGKNLWVSPLAVLNWYESYEAQGSESERAGDGNNNRYELLPEPAAYRGFVRTRKNSDPNMVVDVEKAQSDSWDEVPDSNVRQEGLDL